MSGKYELLNVGRNKKTVKSDKKGWLTGALYLASASQSGYNVCQFSTPGCRKWCLDFTGNGNMHHVREARIRKTQLFFENQPAFMAMLASDIRLLIQEASDKGMRPAVRLNMTSDIPWERIKRIGHYIGRPDQKINYENIMAEFPAVQFYDYTKNPQRACADFPLPPNYSLLFSLADGNEKQARELLGAGVNIAVVFDKLPQSFWGVSVVDGDADDLRFLDERGSIIGLKAKGFAGAKDRDGFIQKIAGMASALAAV